MVLEAIRKRRSIRAFQSRAVEEKKLMEVLKAAMFSPTAHHTRSWEFIVVKDQKTKDLLAQATQWSDFANEAPVVLVLCSKPVEHWIENCSIAAENIYLEATNQGLGTCFIQIRGGRNADGEDAEDYAREILGISKEIRVLCLLPLGYPNEERPEHSDKEFDQRKIHWEKY